MSSPRYLIIDTDPVNRQEFVRLLTDSGGKADYAHDSSQVKDLLSRKKYDCVLVDREVPDIWRDAIDGNTEGEDNRPLVLMTGPGGSAPPDAVIVGRSDGYLPRLRESTELLATHISRTISLLSKDGGSRAGGGSKSLNRSYGRSVARFADSGIIVQTRRIPAPGPNEDISVVVDRGEGRYAILLGDCTFTGNNAELGTLLLEPRIEMYLAESPDPANVLGHLNSELINAGSTIEFMTAVAVLLNIPAKTLRWSVAGHQPPLHRRWGARTWRQLPGTGIPLGVRSGENYIDYNRPLGSGDKILLVTDGLMKIKGSTGGFRNGEFNEFDTIPMNAAPTEVIEVLDEFITSVSGGSAVADEITATLIQV